MDRPATARPVDRPNSPSQAPGAELRVGYPAIRRFALHTALWVAILVVPAAALVYIASQRSDSVYLAEATLMAPTGTFATEALVDTPVATRPLAPRAYHAALGSVDVLSAALVTLGADPEDPSFTDWVADLKEDVSFRYDESRRSILLMIGAHGSSGSSAVSKANALTEALVQWDDARARAQSATGVAALELQLQGLESQLAELRAQGSRASIPQLNSLSLLAAEVRSELAVERSLAVAARGNLEVLQGAARATQLRPSPMVNTAVTLVVGTMLVMLVLLVRASRSQRIEGVEGLAAVTGLPVLATVSGTPSPEMPYLKAHIDRALPEGGSVLVVGVAADDDGDMVAAALADSFDLPGAVTFVNASPALLTSAEAVARTALYDIVILVADPRSSQRGELHEAVTWLRRASADVLGIVAAPRAGSAPASPGRSGGQGRRRRALGARGPHTPSRADERPNTGLGGR